MYISCLKVSLTICSLPKFTWQNLAKLILESFDCGYISIDMLSYEFTYLEYYILYN